MCSLEILRTAGPTLRPLQASRQSIVCLTCALVMTLLVMTLLRRVLKADPTAYLETQLAMITELLTEYGPISRLWFDFYGMGCRQYGADCPVGAFPNGWRNISKLVETISPTTVLTMPGTDGCLLATTGTNNPELGFGNYPSWYYNQGYGQSK